MVSIKTKEEIKILKKGGKILSKILKKVAKKAVIGVSTWELNELAEKLIYEVGGKPSFKNYEGYPAGLCAAINDEVVHGIPSKTKILKEGDIVGLDLGLEYQGFFTDMAVTVGIGRISEEAKKLIKTTRESLEKGIKQVKQNNCLGDIGAAVQKYAEKEGFSVVRDLVGHGVGYQVHEEPQVPNFGQEGQGMKLKAGMVLAIEPMVNVGDYEIETLKDGWTIKTLDGGLSAHFEHTVVVTEKGCEIVTK